MWEMVVKTPLSPLPSTAATVDDAAIGTVGSIPLPPPSIMTAIAAVNNCHFCCHTDDNNDCQKPAVMFVIDGGNGGHCQWKAVVDGGRGDGGLCQHKTSQVFTLDTHGIFTQNKFISMF